MSSTKKIIKMDPGLFKLTKNKTIRNKKSGAVAIDTSKIKEKLAENILKRRKQKQAIEMEKKKEQTEFDKSFNFMLDKSDTQRESHLNQLKRSIKHRPLHPTPLVNVEWPDLPVVDIGTSNPVNVSSFSEKDFDVISLQNTSDSSLNYQLDNAIGYGCLKNGHKKTFKNIKNQNTTIPDNRVRFTNSLIAGSGDFSTYSGLITSAPVAPVVAVPLVAPVINSQPVSPQSVLLQPIPQVPQVSQVSQIPQPVQISPEVSVIHEPIVIQQPTPINETPSSLQEYVPPPVTMNIEPEFIPTEIRKETLKNGAEFEIKVPSIKETVKRKTLKHRYKLGKNKTMGAHNISVLCTSKDRIKQVKDAIKDLQKTPKIKMKQYLMDKNLLSSGSNAPDDVIKKMYEEAYLSADITNHNDKTLLENYLENK